MSLKALPKKSCPRCGIVPMNHVCPVRIKEQHDRDSKREDKQIYWSSRWRKLREEVLEYQEYMCLWSLYVEGMIRQANVGHHIITLLDDDKKAYDIENIIGLDKDAHDRVHELYKIDKKATIEILNECMRLCDKGVKLDGLGVLSDRLVNITNK